MNKYYQLKKFCLSIYLWTLTLPLIFRYAIKAIWLTRRKKLDTLKTTHYLRQLSLQTLSKVQATCQVNVKQKLQFEPNRIYLFMSNHLANYDFPLILTKMPGHIRFIAKKELFSLPIFGKALLNADFLPIEPKNVLMMQDAFAQIKKHSLEKNLRFWAFPEGSRSITGELLPLKSGVFRLAKELDAIIIPAAIWGTQHILPAKQWLFENRGQTISIYVGTPIDTRQFKPYEIVPLLKCVEQAIRELMEKII